MRASLTVSGGAGTVCGAHFENQGGGFRGPLLEQALLESVDCEAVSRAVGDMANGIMTMTVLATHRMSFIGQGCDASWQLTATPGENYTPEHSWAGFISSAHVPRKDPHGQCFLPCLTPMQRHTLHPLAPCKWAIFYSLQLGAHCRVWCLSAVRAEPA